MEKNNQTTDYGKTTRQFDVLEHDDLAIFPMRKVGETTYTIVAIDLATSETDNTYVLEVKE